MLAVLVVYMALGIPAGLLAGLLGVGGGLIIVPILLYGLAWQGVHPDVIPHLALGTSLASIVFTSLSSVRAHHLHDAVLWPVVRYFTPGIVMGTFLGGCIAALLPAKPLILIFAVFLLYVSAQTFLDVKPKNVRKLPGRAGLAGVGAGIGFVSSFVGIGGGTLTVPFLCWCNTNMRQAIGTSAGVGFPIAVAGALSYMVNGWNVPALPSYALGFVYLPALFGLVSTSALAAPYGARLAHKVPVKKLKRFFAVFLLCMAINMIVKFFTL